VQPLARHPELLGDLRNRQSIADHRQDGLIPLFSHAQLPHQGSVKDQPKQLSSIPEQRFFEIARGALYAPKVSD